MKTQWTNYLNTQYDDPYESFKDHILTKCEDTIGLITKELLEGDKTYTPDIAKKMAIALVIEQMLLIQHQNSPEQQKAMVQTLFIELPSVQFTSSIQQNQYQ